MLAHGLFHCLVVLHGLRAASSFTLQHSRRSTLRELQGYSFDRFAEEFGRGYARGTDEWSKRERLFDQRLQEVLSFQSGPPRSWAKGVNHLMDYTDAEFRALLGYRGRRSPAVSAPPHLPAGLISESASTSTFPTSFAVAMNTSLSRFVRNQGACGSCWASAATSVLEGHMALNQEVMAKLTSEASAMREDIPTLSQQALVSCTENPRHCGGTGGCDGATTELAFDMVMQKGVPLAATWPYVSGRGYTPKCDQHAFANWRVGITGYKVLPKNKLRSLKHSLVASGGPVAVSVDAEGWRMYSEGIYSDRDGGKPGEFTVDHAVTLMGFRDPADGLPGYWLIKNSWGPNWGEQGFIRLEMKSDEEEHCGWDYEPKAGLACDGDPDQVWVCGTCGILYDSAYPTGVHLSHP